MVMLSPGRERYTVMPRYLLDIRVSLWSSRELFTVILWPGREYILVTRRPGREFFTVMRCSSRE